MDNPVNTYEEVITVCALVLEVSLEEGFRIASTVDHEGSCVVGAWPRAEAEKIAQGIAVIGIEVRLEPLDD
jgi:ATP-dependent Clp protease adapter protein ClpS